MLAYVAVQKRFKARFITISDFIMQMSNAKKEKQYILEASKYKVFTE